MSEDRGVFRGKVAFVTGAANGIGRAAALEFSREGASVVVADSESVGRPASPDETAAAVVWLCSDAAAFVVGHAMVIDGGQTV